MFGLNQGAGSMIHGTEATLFVNRSMCRLIPNNRSKGANVWEDDAEMQQMNVPHPGPKCPRSSSLNFGQ
jgi:hypothetical protein